MNPQKKIIFILILLLSLSFFNDSSYADEELFKNELGLYIAGTTNLDSDKTAFTIGADYERKVNILEMGFGIGLFAEAAFFDEKEFLIGVPFTFYLIEGFGVGVAPGIALIDREEGTEEEFLFRIKAGYTFDIGSKYFVKPALALDFIGGDKELVYGGVIGIRF